jgi:hypothetical protein
MRHEAALYLNGRAPIFSILGRVGRHPSPDTPAVRQKPTLRQQLGEPQARTLLGVRFYGRSMKRNIEPEF